MPDPPLPLVPSDVEDPTFRVKFFDLPDLIVQWAAPYIETEGAQILDFGCGEATTALGFALRKGASRVVGVDIVSDPDLCAPYARQHLGLDRLPANLELHRVEPGRLHNEEDRFDLIYAWSVVEHVRQDLVGATLSMLNDRLRDGGLLFVQISPLYYSSEGSHLFHKIPERWGHLRHQHSEYLALLRQACGDQAEYRALVGTYETLNRITAPRLVAAIRGARFTILREHYREEDFEPPPEVAEAYERTVLRMAEIAILARHVSAPEAAASGPDSSRLATANASFNEEVEALRNSLIVSPAPQQKPEGRDMNEGVTDLSRERLRLDLPRFCDAHPSHANALSLRAGTWKFDFDRLEMDAIREWVGRDVRPRWSAEVFPGFSEFSVIELGPQDGFVTAGLEAFGVGSILAIEANVDSFLRCLLLKNALGLKATYLLGDFLTYLDAATASADLIYASGVLYHLFDPVGLLLRCAEVARHLYLWTFHYNENAIRANAYESLCFDGVSEHRVRDEVFTYHRRFYTPDILAAPTYAGGISAYANWMTLEDIERALHVAGYRIERMIEDSFQGIPAMNIWATR
jgi:SAM-dependent methyltransferase